MTDVWAVTHMIEEAQKRKHLMQLGKVRKGLTGDVRPSLKQEVKASQLEHGAEVKRWE